MKILLTGGTGFIGKELIKCFRTEQIVLLTRNPQNATAKFTTREYWKYHLHQHIR